MTISGSSPRQKACKSKGSPCAACQCRVGELFEALPQLERDAVLPPPVIARLAVEAAVAQGWHRYVGAAGDVLSVERFGASAPVEVLLSVYGFSVEDVCRRTLALRRGPQRRCRGSSRERPSHRLRAPIAH